MERTYAGFDWDVANRAKCEKHGVTIEDIEHMFRRIVRIAPDPKHSLREDRFVAVGRSTEGRPLFVAFTVREKGGERFVRPVSARYMHKKESDKYEEAEGS